MGQPLNINSFLLEANIDQLPTKHNLSTAIEPQTINEAGDDDLMTRRRKNREASKRSRERKVRVVSDLEMKLRNAEKIVANLQAGLQVAKEERDLVVMQLELRIGSLEEQLAQAHQKLLLRDSF